MGAVFTAALPPEDHPGTSYRVERNVYGVAVYGYVPVSDLLAMMKGWEEAGMDTIDASLCMALRATMVCGKKEDLAAWRKKLDAEAEERAGEDLELAWVDGTDIGTSALAIMAALGSSVHARARAHSRLPLGVDWPPVDAHPHDPDDLARCIRLLDRFPGYRERLGEVAATFPGWSGLVARWGELEETFRRECPTGYGEAQETYRKMKEILYE